MLSFKSRIGKVQMGQTKGEFTIICLSFFFLDAKVQEIKGKAGHDQGRGSGSI